MKWIKAGLIGALAALIMFLILFAGTQTGLAPINVPPSAAFLHMLDMVPEPAIQPIAAIGHFAYGIFWAIVLIAIFKEDTTVVKGLGLGLVLWLIMMLGFSPLIGWGFFGFDGVAHGLARDEPLWIGNPVIYLVVTLVLHIIYGAVVGWLAPLWAFREESEPQKQPAQAA